MIPLRRTVGVWAVLTVLPVPVVAIAALSAGLTRSPSVIGSWVLLAACIVWFAWPLVHVARIQAGAVVMGCAVESSPPALVRDPRGLLRQVRKRRVSTWQRVGPVHGDRQRGRAVAREPRQRDVVDCTGGIPDPGLALLVLVLEHFGVILRRTRRTGVGAQICRSALVVLHRPAGLREERRPGTMR